MKIIKIFANTLTVMLALVIMWLCFDLVIAAQNTPKIVAEAMAKNKMALEITDFSQYRIDALLKVEDPAFYKHRGVDFKTPGAGITTISQGLVKLLYFKKFQPGFAKVRQTLIARYAFNALTPKDTQLKLFINMVYLGNPYGTPVYGFEDAAKTYFKKDFKSITDDQYLSLLAMVISPAAFSPVKNPEGNAERVRRIKLLLSGEYKPKANMDVYYGKLTQKELELGIPTASYYEGLYK